MKRSVVKLGWLALLVLPVVSCWWFQGAPAGHIEDSVSNGFAPAFPQGSGEVRPRDDGEVPPRNDAADLEAARVESRPPDRRDAASMWRALLPSYMGVEVHPARLTLQSGAIRESGADCLVRWLPDDDGHHAMLTAEGYAAVMVTLEPRPTSPLQVELRPGSALSVFVVDEYGQPLAGVPVNISIGATCPLPKEGRSYWSSSTDAGGRCEFPFLEPGVWDVKALASRGYLETEWNTQWLTAAAVACCTVAMERDEPDNWVSFRLQNHSGIEAEFRFPDFEMVWELAPVEADGLVYVPTEPGEMVRVQWRLRGSAKVIETTAVAGDRGLFVELK